MNQKQFGSWAEEVALDLLLQLGFELIAKNFRLKRGEIDIIVFRDNTLHFVEVKASRQGIEPGLSLTPGKQKQIHRIAKFFLAQNHQWLGYPCQFDAVLIDQFQNDFKTRFYPNAFIPVTLNYF